MDPSCDIYVVGIVVVESSGRMSNVLSKVCSEDLEAVLFRVHTNKMSSRKSRNLSSAPYTRAAVTPLNAVATPVGTESAAATAGPIAESNQAKGTRTAYRAGSSRGRARNSWFHKYRVGNVSSREAQVYESVPLIDEDALPSSTSDESADKCAPAMLRELEDISLSQDEQTEQHANINVRLVAHAHLACAVSASQREQAENCSFQSGNSDSQVDPTRE